MITLWTGVAWTGKWLTSRRDIGRSKCYLPNSCENVRLLLFLTIGEVNDNSFKM